MKFRRVTENNTLIPGILDALAFYPDVFAFRVESEGTRGRRPAVPKGTADILGVVKRRLVMPLSSPGPSLIPGVLDVKASHRLLLYGQSFAVETKDSHGLNCGRKACSCADQRLWRTEWEKRGGLYILAETTQAAVDGVLKFTQ